MYLTKDRIIAQRQIDTERYILSTMPAFYAPFYKKDGSVFISGDGYGYTCTVTGALWTPQGRLFDATNDKIVFGDTTTLAWMHGKGNTTAFKWTVIVWFNQLHPGTANAVFLDTTLGSSSNTGIWFAADTNRKLNMAITRGAAGNVMGNTSTTAYPNNTAFNQVIWTYDQSLATVNSTCMLNGVEIETANKTANAPNDANSTYAPCIGFQQTTTPFDGTQGEMIIYDRVFSAAERQNSYLTSKWRWK